MWVDKTLKCPDEGEWLAVVRVNAGGDTELVRYMHDLPADVDRDLDAVQQRWTLRAMWPGDQEIQDGARIFDFQKYPEEHDV